MDSPDPCTRVAAPRPVQDDYRTQCFLCFRAFGDDVVSTQEDVIPMWVFNDFDLAAASSSVPGGQSFRYTQRRVPCCLECNGFLSRELELPVSKAARAGFAAFASLPPVTVMLWLAKIYYGTRYLETRLRWDVRDSAAPTIGSADELLGENEYLRQCLLTSPAHLQLVRPPCSLLLFRAGVPPVRAQQFDFFVSGMGGDLLSLRLGEVFAVAVFGDNGWMQHQLGATHEDVRAALELELHPLQCRELMVTLATELARVETSGCWDCLSIGNGDPTRAGGVARVLDPQFTVAEAQVDLATLGRRRVEAFFWAVGRSPADEDLGNGAAGHFPSLLRRGGEPVRAECFDPSCGDLLVRAGWIQDLVGARCAGCAGG